MARFCGEIGFAQNVETSQDVWEDVITARKYFGDVITVKKRTESGEGLNDNFRLSTRISIVSDPFADEHLADIRYAVLHGTKWKVTDAEVLYPRIVLSLGEVYNEQKN